MSWRLEKIRLFWPGWLVLAAVLVGSASLGLAQTSGKPHRKRKDLYREQVEQMEQAWRTAQLADDVNAMDKLLSDDYVGITMTGQVVTKMQQLDRMRNRELELTTISLEDMKVKLIGTAAIVTSLASIEGTDDGVPMHGTYRYTRVYSRLPTGTWKITNFEVTRVGSPQGPGGRHHHGEQAPGSASPAPVQPPPNSN